MTTTTTPTAKDLIKSAEEAWRQARAAKEAANKADEAVKKYLVGRRIRISGSASPISGGTIHSDFGRRKFLNHEPVLVTAVFYYFNETYQSREDSIRVIATDGSEYELAISSSTIKEIEESQDASNA